MSSISSRCRGVWQVCHPTKGARDRYVAYDRETGATTSQSGGDNRAGEFNVLALPDDYTGPLLVCDIDGTLRDTRVRDLATAKVQPPIEGAMGLLTAASAMGVPIVYLSAAGRRMHAANQAFLAQLPPGILLDRGRHSLNPSNARQADLQAAYKTSMLQALRASWSHAQVFGLGDNHYGDARAYQAAGVRSYIHEVDPNHRNVPAHFTGVLTRAYTPEVQRRFAAELRAAMKHAPQQAPSTAAPPLPGTPMGPVSGATCLYRVQAG